MDLDAGLGIRHGVGVASEMMASFQHKNGLAQDCGDALSHCGAKKTTADNNESEF
ncbi:protein of unknown function [Rhodovastum atsumiense]|nr:protein of unknown function [Rhodovastum atsumiense]